MTEATDVLAALATSEAISGQTLAQRLRVSRTRIWQLVSHLRSRGYVIHSRPGKGYQWAAPFAPLEAHALARELPAGWSLAAVWETDSTNTRIVAERADRHILFAEHQAAGRGRVGRGWVSAPGGLYCSAGRSFEALTPGLQRLSPWVAAHLVAALRGMGATGVSAKWPNDLVLAGRKLGGVLIEVSGDPFGRCHVCVGVGVNWYSPPVTEQAVAGLVEGLASGAERNRVGAGLAAAVARAVDGYPHAEPGEVIDAWQAVDGLLGRTVTCRHGRSCVTGRVAGIDCDGALCLTTEHGSRRFAAGELHLDAP